MKDEQDEVPPQVGGVGMDYAEDENPFSGGESRAAEELVEALWQRPEFKAYKEDEMHSRLVQMVSEALPLSTELFSTLPLHQETLQEATDCYHYLQLRRVIRNSRVKGHKPSPWQRAWDSARARTYRYSSDAKVRSAVADPEIAAMIADSPHELTLLGKLDTFEYVGNTNDHFQITKPLLVIPGQTNIARVRYWEEEHKRYDVDSGAFVNLPTSRERYLTANKNLEETTAIEQELASLHPRFDRKAPVMVTCVGYIKEDLGDGLMLHFQDGQEIEYPLDSTKKRGLDAGENKFFVEVMYREGGMTHRDIVRLDRPANT